MTSMGTPVYECSAWSGQQRALVPVDLELRGDAQFNKVQGTKLVLCGNSVCS